MKKVIKVKKIAGIIQGINRVVSDPSQNLEGRGALQRENPPPDPQMPGFRNS